MEGLLLNFLEKLCYLMEKNKLNRHSLSVACGIPYNTINSWYKQGYEGLKLTSLRKLADFFDTSLDFCPAHGTYPGTHECSASYLLCALFHFLH